MPGSDSYVGQYGEIMPGPFSYVGQYFVFLNYVKCCGRDSYIFFRLLMLEGRSVRRTSCKAMVHGPIYESRPTPQQCIYGYENWGWITTQWAHNINITLDIGWI
jgi:hypothetical protein